MVERSPRMAPASADNPFDEFGFPVASSFLSSPHPAVAQDRRAVGDLHHLVDVMRDENNAHAWTQSAAQARRADHVAFGRNGVGSSKTSKPAPSRIPRQLSIARTMASSARSTGGSGPARPGRAQRRTPQRGFCPAPLRSPIDRPCARPRAGRPAYFKGAQPRNESEMLVHEAHSALATRPAPAATGRRRRRSQACSPDRGRGTPREP